MLEVNKRIFNFYECSDELFVHGFVPVGDGVCLG